MADLNQAEKDVETAESDLEARVTAHEQKDAQTSKDLQAQIDALKAGADNSAVIAALQALKGKIDAFDPAAPAG